MKKLFLFLLPLAVLACACNQLKQQEPENPGTDDSPKVKLQIIIDESAFLNMPVGEKRDAAYQVTAPDGVSFTLEASAPKDWTVTISNPKGKEGTVSLTLPVDAVDGKVTLSATGSDGSLYSKELQVTLAPVPDPDPISYQESVDAGAGSLDLPEGAGNVVIPEAASWIILSGTKLILAENTDYDSRQAVVTFNVGKQAYILTVVQAQKDAIVLTESTLEVEAEGAHIPLVLKANVDISATSNAAWAIIEMATKGLEEKPFTLTVLANESEEGRTATITFASGELSQTLTLNQAGFIRPTLDGVFTLVTSEEDILAGDQLLIVSPDGKQAMGAQDAKYRNAVDITLEDDGTILNPYADVALVTLEGVPGAWVFTVEDGYLGAQESRRNYLQTYEPLTDYSKWTVSIASDGTATVMALAGSYNHLRYNYNQGNPRFSCYGSNTGLDTEVKLYRKETEPATPVTQYDNFGIYLGGRQRIYAPGTDQLVRFYDGEELCFVLTDPDEEEYVILSGLQASPEVGADVLVNVSWTKADDKVMEHEFKMSVLQVDGSKVWIGDTRGRGFVVKK
ncbi:MAG: BACON domain-containing protein [Bacteroidales bacterium]|nr:BACON domain-containing protein [Bacteroidales bacterium]